MGVIAKVGRVVLQHGVEDIGGNLASYDIVAVVEGEELAQEVVSLALLHINADDAGNETGQRVADSGGALLESSIEEVLASKLALVPGCVGPMPVDEAESLDRSELANAGIAVGQGDLDEEQKRLRLGVVVLLEVGGDGLDLLSVGWEQLLAPASRRGRGGGASARSRRGVYSRTWLPCSSWASLSLSIFVTCRSKRCSLCLGRRCFFFF
jgi:hypothetical protein